MKDAKMRGSPGVFFEIAGIYGPDEINVASHTGMIARTDIERFPADDTTAPGTLVCSVWMDNTGEFETECRELGHECSPELRDCIRLAQESLRNACGRKETGGP